MEKVRIQTGRGFFRCRYVEYLRRESIDFFEVGSSRRRIAILDVFFLAGWLWMLLAVFFHATNG